MERVKNKKPSNGHLSYNDGHKTITIQWGVKSLLLVCFTAISITALQVFGKR